MRLWDSRGVEVYGLGIVRVAQLKRGIGSVVACPEMGEMTREGEALILGHDFSLRASRGPKAASTSRCSRSRAAVTSSSASRNLEISARSVATTVVSVSADATRSMSCGWSDNGVLRREFVAVFAMRAVSIALWIVAAFVHCILDVLAHGPWPDMVWVHTLRVIAGMACHLPFWERSAMNQFPHDLRSGTITSINPDHSIWTLALS